MKLTDRQIKIRALFREAVLLAWHTHDKYLMFNVIYRIANEFDITFDAARIEMAEIPSIGKFHKTMPASAWLARHYRVVSDALFDGKTDEYALVLWKNTKRTDGGEKRTREEKAENQRINRNTRKLAAFAELRKNMPDRWGRSDWKKVK